VLSGLKEDDVVVQSPTAALQEGLHVEPFAMR